MWSWTFTLAGLGIEPVWLLAFQHFRASTLTSIVTVNPRSRALCMWLWAFTFAALGIEPVWLLAVQHFRAGTLAGVMVENPRS